VRVIVLFLVQREMVPLKQVGRKGKRFRNLIGVLGTCVQIPGQQTPKQYHPIPLPLATPHSMLIFISPSFVSTMPWKPTRFIGPPLGTGFPDSPLLPGRLPHGSRCIGLCMTGLLCTLIPGLTALRLKLVGSKSSSRRRLLFTLRVISAAVGCGVNDREGDE